MRPLTGVAALAGTAVAATVLTGCGFSVGRHQETRSYDTAADIAELKVTATNGTVEITGSDSPGIRVRERLTWSNDHNKPDPQHVTEGRTLTLSAKCGRNMFGPGSCGISYRVEVPRATAVNVDTGDGGIKVSGLSGSSVRLSTDSGSITAAGLRAKALSARTGDGPIRIDGQAGTANLRTDSGHITATGLGADRLAARTGDGPIRIDGRALTADLSTDSGGITTGLHTDDLTVRVGDGPLRLGFTRPPKRVRAQTDSGSVRLGLPDTTGGYSIELSNDSGGKPWIDPGVAQNSRSERRITVRTGDGPITVAPA